MRVLLLLLAQIRTLVTIFVLGLTFHANGREVREGSVLAHSCSLHQNILNLNSDAKQSQSETFQQYLNVTLDVFAKYNCDHYEPLGMWCDGNMYQIPEEGLRCRFLGQLKMDEKAESVGNAKGMAFVKVRGYLQLYSLPTQLFGIDWKYKILEVTKTEAILTEGSPQAGGGISSAGGKKAHPAQRD